MSIERFAACVLLISSNSALAADIEFPDGRPQQVINQGTVANPQPLKCCIHWQDTVLHGTPNSDAPALPYVSRSGESRSRLPFLTHTFHIADKHRTAGQEFALLARPASQFDLSVVEFYGWVPLQHCLTFTGRGPQALKDPQTHIHRKCMLINELQRDPSSAAPRSDVGFFSRPDQQGGERLRRRFFEIYYIYDEAPEHDALFVGSSAAIRGAGAQERVQNLIGWIHKDTVCLWNTREALEFNKRDERTLPGIVFRTRAQVQEYVNTSPAPTTDELELRQPAVHVCFEDRRSTRALNFDVPRYPILKGETAESELLVNGCRIYKIGIIGDVYDQDEMQLTKETLATLQVRGDRHMRAARVIEIAFVVDGTFSMQRWFGVMKEAIRQIMVDVNRIDSVVSPELVRFSVNFYRSDNEGPLKYEGNDFGDEVAVQEVLEQARAIGGGGNTRLYHGLVQTIKKMSPDKASTKIIIVIGDDGNTSTDQQHTPQHVSAELERLGKLFPVGFFAISVNDDQSGINQRQRLFQTQMQQIASTLVRKQVAKLQQGELDVDSSAVQAAVKELTGQVLVSSDTATITNAITTRFDLAVAEAQYRHSRILEIIKGNIPIDETTFANPLASATRAHQVVWERQILDLASEQFSGLLQDGVQIFEEGWIAEVHPDESIPAGHSRQPLAVHHAVFLHKSELRQFTDFLRVLTRRHQPGVTEEAWLKTLKQVTGEEDLDSLSPGDLMAMQGWGVTQRGLLNLKFNELGRLDARRRHQFRLELERRIMQMQDALDERSGQYVLVNSDDPGSFEKHWKRVEVSGERPQTWFPRGAASDQRAWIDRDVLP